MLKKMMALLVAISCAFGAWADVTGHLSGTDFSPRDAGSFDTSLDDNGKDTGTNYWFTGDTSFVGTIVTNALEEKFLDFESNITNPLYRTIVNCGDATNPVQFTATPIGDGLFIDTHVQFTPYLVNDNHPAPTGSGEDKLIVWLRETEGENGANVTNLIVTAGYLDDNGDATPSNYVANISQDAASALCSGQHRLTIKSYENITTYSGVYVMGFVVYIDETAIEYEGNAFTDDCAFFPLAPTPAQWYTQNGGYNKLFPCLMNYGTDATPIASYSKLSGVGYAGMGKIGDVFFDTYATDYPKFARDDRMFSVEMGEGVTEYMYNNVRYTASSNLTAGATDSSVIISNVVYSSGYQHKDDTWYNTSSILGIQIVSNRVDASGKDYGTFYFADGDAFTLAGFQRNYLVVDGGTTNEYQTLFGNATENGAIVDAMANGTVFMLTKDTAIDEAGYHYIVVGENEHLTIDLNGHTLRGSSNDDSTYTIRNIGGYLTITDTSDSQTGAVLGSLYLEGEDLISNSMAVFSGEGAVETKLLAGKYESISEEKGSAVEITAGTYLDLSHASAADPFYLEGKLASGSTVTGWTEDDDLWYATVGLAGGITYEVSFSTNTFVVAEYTTNITAGATLPDAAIPAFTGGAWDLDPTNAVINAATNFNYTIVASYTLTYASDHGAIPDGETYTASTPDFALAAAPTAEGWTFGGWLIGSVVFDAGDTFVVADHLENTTATAVWTPTAYTLTYVTDKGTAPDAVSYTVESNNFALAAAPDPGVVGVQFAGWVIGSVTNEAGATFVVADHLENTTATAAWVALAPPKKFPQSDTAGTEYAGRDGTPALPFVIRKYDDLVLLKNAVADGEITTESFEVVSNITGVTDWVGIGTSSSVAFAGTLNGNGKTINVTFAAGAKYNGLFAFVNNATLSNLTVNVTAGAVEGETGGAAFVGKAYGSCTFAALKATGSLGSSSVPVTHNAASMVVSLNGNGGAFNFNNCTNEMAIYANYTKVGGLVAFRANAEDSAINFNNCVNSASINNISENAAECSGTGGLMGWTGYANPSKITVNGCASIGSVTATNGTASSIVGYNSVTPVMTGVNTVLASLKPSGTSTIGGCNWATVSGDIATFVTPVSTVDGIVTYKRMQSGDGSLGFTLADADASLTILTNFYGYTGTVTVDPTLTAQGYELVETADANGVTFTCAIPGPADPWAPTEQTDEAASNKVVSIFGDGSDVANHVTTLAEYGALVAYITNVTSEATVPTDLTKDQKAWMWKSFILGANPLFDDDVAVEITSLTANSEAGKWDFTVKVTEGESTDAYNVAADKVGALVKIRTSLTTGTWITPTSTNIEAIKPVGGNLIKVTVNFGDGASGFMKVSE